MGNYTIIRAFHDKISFLIHRKAFRYNVYFFLFLVVLFVLSAGMGEQIFSPWKVIHILSGNSNNFELMIVQSFRMPRIIISILVGISLAIAGAILQAILRNPIASPDVTGITGGASVAVVLFLALFSDENNALTVSIHWLPLAAFIGATIVAILLYILSWKNGLSPFRLVLVGIGLWALTKALTNLFMILGPIYRASQANIWLTGSVYGANWSNVQILTPITVVLILVALIMTRHLNILELGEDVALGVGTKVEKKRLLLLLLTTALIGSAVAFAGGIGFIGLMAPHIARKLVGSSFGNLLPLSAIIGAILVLVADTIGRTFFLPIEVPAGVFTAAIGAPYFIYLLFRQRNA
ncbi:MULTISPECIES: iron ABC transporter permease [Lysinibacillus]|uniref:Iron ABC transporter permease n=1 Tax=Lysinibacillus antri TaxID=2498145 RepID=A0A432LA11_9BACI|nr:MULTISPECIES: iron ABC transporter permease [Lysinibacillus]RUL50485.1 iron ABC transporter permease [Lysinibacillus antri]TSI07683.1 iron ABC transporter permease [Lysinibacillus sp. BW-2-10]